jgi:hypothetical protein
MPSGGQGILPGGEKDIGWAIDPDGGVIHIKNLLPVAELDLGCSAVKCTVQPAGGSVNKKGAATIDVIAVDTQPFNSTDGFYDVSQIDFLMKKIFTVIEVADIAGCSELHTGAFGADLHHGNANLVAALQAILASWRSQRLKLVYHDRNDNLEAFYDLRRHFAQDSQVSYLDVLHVIATSHWGYGETGKTQFDMVYLGPPRRDSSTTSGPTPGPGGDGDLHGGGGGLGQAFFVFGCFLVAMTVLYVSFVGRPRAIDLFLAGHIGRPAPVAERQGTELPNTSFPIAATGEPATSFPIAATEEPAISGRSFAIAVGEEPRSSVANANTVFFSTPDPARQE